MITKWVAVLFVLAVLLTGCGREDEAADSSRPDEGGQSEAENDDDVQAPSPADQAVAEAALLTLDDFPAGWEAQPADEDEEDEETQRRIAECVGVAYEDLYQGDSSATADSQKFVSTDDSEVSNSVNVGADEDWAANAFEIASRPEFRECTIDETRKAIDEAAEEEDLEVGELSLNEISFDDYGDDTLAFRLTIPLEVQGLSLEATGDFVLVRVGRALTTVTTFSTETPFDVETLSEFTRIATDRLTEELQ